MNKILIIASIIITAVACVSLLTSCNDQTYMQGARLYTFHCANCHMEDGSGLKNVIPSISESTYFDQKIDSLPCLIRHGKSNFMTPDSAIISMPVNYNLTEYEINNVINHIITSWYPERDAVSIQSTRAWLEDCPIPAMRYGQ